MAQEKQPIDLGRELRRMRRWCLLLTAGLILVVGAAAAPPLALLVCKSLEVKTDDGKTVVRMDRDGIVVGETNLLDELKSQQITEVPFRIDAIPHLPDHKFWSVTKGGTKRSVQYAAIDNGPQLIEAIDHAAASSEPFGEQIIAAWIVPEYGMHETFDSTRLVTLETKVVEKNRLVIHAQCLSKDATYIGGKIIVVYRKKVSGR
jgi:hypothetical protein